MLQVFSGAGLTAREQVVWTELADALRQLENEGFTVLTILPLWLRCNASGFAEITDYAVVAISCPPDSGVFLFCWRAGLCI